jgi:hypothetical protein
MRKCQFEFFASSAKYREPTFPLFNKKRMTDNSNNLNSDTHNKVFFRRLLFVFCLMLFAYGSLTSLSAQTNSPAADGTQFSLNDPRNPNCPCHKQQQLADEEYKQLLKSAQLVKVKQKNTNEDLLVISNRAANISRDVQQDNNNVGPNINQVVLPEINKPEINFSKTSKPSFAANSSGGSCKFKKHKFKKVSFKISKKTKKVFYRKKKIKIDYSSCFKW